MGILVKYENARRARNLAHYDPARGLQEIVVAEAAERHWKHAKDPTQLYIAIEAKIRNQADYVVWRDSVVEHGGDRKSGSRLQNRNLDPLPAADPGAVAAHRWRKAFCKIVEDLDDDGRPRKTTIPDEDKIALELDEATRRCARLIEKDNDGLNDGRDEYGTPPPIVEIVRAFYGGQIGCDPASNEVAQRTVRATIYYTKQQNGLEQPWPGKTFLNGPYSDLGPWVNKLLSEYDAGHATEVIALTNAAVGTEWFNVLLAAAARACFLRDRVRFLLNGEARNSPTTGQVLFYVGPRFSQFTEAFRPLGSVVRVAA
jgi:hypothetical protein